MFTSTRSSKLKHYTNESCETVLFEKKKKNLKLNTDLGGDGEKKIVESKDSKLDLRKLRYDVIKLGTSGFAGAKREESNVVLAVSLGAKPPKNKYKNYKEILMEKKTAKQQEKYSVRANVSKKTRLKGKKKLNSKQGDTGLLHEYGKCKPKNKTAHV